MKRFSSLTIFLLFIGGLLSISMIFPIDVLAQSTENLDRFRLSPATSTSDIRQYIVQFYGFIIPASMLIATVLIMVGGVIWITSAGDQGRIAKAREFIINSIIGVVILLGSFITLAAVNPNLVNLTLPQFSPLSIPGACIISQKPNCRDFVTSKTCKTELKGTFHQGKACADISAQVEKKKEEVKEEKRAEEQSKIIGRCYDYVTDDDDDNCVDRKVANCKGLPPRAWTYEAGKTCGGRQAIKGRTKAECEKLKRYPPSETFSFDTTVCDKACKAVGCIRDTSKDVEDHDGHLTCHCTL